MGFLNRASRSIDRYCRRKFYPLRQTRYYDYRESDSIRLDAELLQLDTLTTQNGGETIDPSLLLLKTGDNYNYGPWDTLVLRSDSGSLLSYSSTDQKANAVTGFWGYHEDYPNAWVHTGTSLAANYSASDLTLSIGGASAGPGASDANYDAPRLSPGDLVSIDGEMMAIAAGLNPSLIAVAPFQNGTSAASHASGTPIYKFAPEPDINWATLRLTSWLYGQGMSPYESKTAFIQIGILSVPQAVATDVKDKIDRYRRTTLVIYPDK